MPWMKLRNAISEPWCSGVIALGPTKRDELWTKVLEAKPKLDYYQPKDEALKVYLNWQAVAIMEMIRLDGFKQDPQWIKDRFRGEVDVKGIQKFLQDLIRTGFVEKDNRGRLRLTNEANFAGGDVPSQMIQLYHQSVSQEAVKALYNVAVELREFAAITVGVDDADVQALKEEIREFRQRVLLRVKQNKTKHVYQLNVQFFPLTEPAQANPIIDKKKKAA